MTNQVQELLVERGKSHGSFMENSSFSQTVKSMMREEHNWSYNDLEDDQKEALDYIVMKMTRILSGDPDHIDHWDDIAGYATLVANRLRNG